MQDRSQSPWQFDERLAWNASTEHFRRMKRDGGVSASFRLAQRLWQDARQLRPDWPSADERDNDHATHLKVCEALAAIKNRIL